jgi:hypothetical protein
VSEPPGSPPVRLEPPAVASRPARPEADESRGGLHIGSLEVRIVPAADRGEHKPAPAPVSTASRIRPAAASAARPGPLARGFRSFGLTQG